MKKENIDINNNNWISERASNFPGGPTIITCGRELNRKFCYVFRVG